VRVKEGSGEVKTWKIVNPDYGARGEGELSARSPVGEALLGHVAGELVVVETRNGPRQLTIEQVV
jgi:transcription elongation GreA/GreB family factor